MKNEGQVGTYVSGTTGLDLPRPTKRRRGHIAVQPRCKTCRLPLSGRGDHLCLDLSAPEPVIVRVPRATTKRVTKEPNKYRKSRDEMTSDELEKARARDRAYKSRRGTCACGSSISAAAKTCAKCMGLTRRKFTDAQEAEMAAAYLDGASAAALARLHGVTDTAIRAALVRQGAQIRPQGTRVTKKAA